MKNHVLKKSDISLNQRTILGVKYCIPKQTESYRTFNAPLYNITLFSLICSISNWFSFLVWQSFKKNWIDITKWYYTPVHLCWRLSLTWPDFKWLHSLGSVADRNKRCGSYWHSEQFFSQSLQSRAHKFCFLIMRFLLNLSWLKVRPLPSV